MPYLWHVNVPFGAQIEANMADIADRTQDFGANSWLVEEMYEQFRADPSSVTEPWREFFSDYRSAAYSTAAPVTAAAPTALRARRARRKRGDCRQETRRGWACQCKDRPSPGGPPGAAVLQ